MKLFDLLLLPLYLLVFLAYGALDGCLTLFVGGGKLLVKLVYLSNRRLMLVLDALILFVESDSPHKKNNGQRCEETGCNGHVHISKATLMPNDGAEACAPKPNANPKG